VVCGGLGRDCVVGQFMLFQLSGGYYFLSVLERLLECHQRLHFFSPLVDALSVWFSGGSLRIEVFLFRAWLVTSPIFENGFFSLDPNQLD